ncbi:MAG: hypothetical protein Q4A32_03435 [Lachnospiraceae bacterium]|nr:hypothetical protein [Lachnospiraceae bacterium]
MKYGKRILTVLIVLALVAGAVGGVIYGVQKSQERTITVYHAADLNYNWYASDEGDNLEGYVTADAAQNVYVSDATTVKEITVSEGQEVVVGDVLVVYDTEKARLNLEKAQLSEQQIHLLLDVANRNLQTLNSLKPVKAAVEEAEEEEVYVELDDDWEEDEWVIVDLEETDEDESGEEDEPEKEKPTAYGKLDADTLPYNIDDFIIITREDLDPEEIEGMTDEEIDLYLEQLMGPRLGTEENPYRFLCSNGAVISPAFINRLKKQAEEEGGSLFIQLEVREGDIEKGKLIEAWKMDAARFVKVGKDWTAKVIVDSYISTPSPTPTKKPKTTPTEKAKASPTDKAKKTITPEPTITVTISPTAPPDDSSGTELPDDSSAESVPSDSSVTDMSDGGPTDSSEPSEDISATPSKTDTPDVPDDSEADSVSEMTISESPIPESETGNRIPDVTQMPPSGEDLQGAKATAPSPARPDDVIDGGAAMPDIGTMGRGNGGLSYATYGMTEKYLLTAMATGSGSSGFDSEGAKSSSQIALSIGLIPSDSEMTAEEIKEAKKQEEQTIKSLNLDLREAVLKTKEAEEALEEGSTKAKMNGVVKKVTDSISATGSGSPIVQVTAAEGLFVKSAIPESLYGTIKAGDFAKIMSWTTGQTFSGRVRDVSYYPDTSGMFGYGASATYYPVTIYVSERSEALTDGEWVQVKVNGTGEQTFENASDKLYLYRAFIREDEGGKYVLMRGEDGLLAKRYVRTGELSGEAFEILSGVTTDDYLAFPYGKYLSEGSKTREGTIDELYMS